MENHHAINGKISTISMAIFNSYVSLPEGIFHSVDYNPIKPHEIPMKPHGKSLTVKLPEGRSNQLSSILSIFLDLAGPSWLHDKSSRDSPKCDLG